MTDTPIPEPRPTTWGKNDNLAPWRKMYGKNSALRARLTRSGRAEDVAGGIYYRGGGDYATALRLIDEVRSLEDRAELAQKLRDALMRVRATGVAETDQGRGKGWWIPDDVMEQACEALDEFDDLRRR